MGSVDSNRLFVRSGPFAFGLVPSRYPFRLNSRFLRKIVEYAATKHRQSFPLLTGSDWRRIATYKLQLPEDLSDVYFNTFSMVSANLSQMSLRERATNDDVQVNILQMVVFLFLQRFLEEDECLNGEDSDVSVADGDIGRLEKHVATAVGADLNGASSQRIPTIDSEEFTRLAFVQVNLRSLVDVLCSWQEVDAALVPESVVEALDFLIGVDTEGSISSESSCSLIQLAVSPMLVQVSGYVSRKRAFDADQLTAWLVQSVVVDPHGLAPVVSASLPRLWQESSDRQVLGVAVTSDYHMLIHGCRKQTLVYTDHGGDKGRTQLSTCPTVTVSACCECFVYLVSALRNVLIQDSSDSTFLLGPVAGCVRVRRCLRVRLITATCRLVVSSSAYMTLHVLTPSRPVLADVRGVTVAPFNTDYGAELRRQMTVSRLSDQINLWDRPVCLQPGHGGSGQRCCCWSVLPPERFFVFKVPFENRAFAGRDGAEISSIEGQSLGNARLDRDGDPLSCRQTTCEIGDDCGVFGRLPTAYKLALQQRQAAWRAVCVSVKAASLSRQQRLRLRKITRRRFHDWLASSGKQRELHSLSQFRRVVRLPLIN